MASWTSCLLGGRTQTLKTWAKVATGLNDGKGDLMKTAINCHRLKLWLDADGGGGKGVD